MHYLHSFNIILNMYLSFFDISLPYFFTLFKPIGPVHAFALPELINKYFVLISLIYFFDSKTGAAANLFLAAQELKKFQRN